MTDNQHKAIAYFDQQNANAVIFPRTGWIRRDDVRCSETSALYLLHHAAGHTGNFGYCDDCPKFMEAK